jgi:hypothetical protein
MPLDGVGLSKSDSMTEHSTRDFSINFGPQHDEAKRVVYEPVKLVQEMRQFDYLSPWEGTEYVLPGDEKAK